MRTKLFFETEVSLSRTLSRGKVYPPHRYKKKYYSTDLTNLTKIKDCFLSNSINKNIKEEVSGKKAYAPIPFFKEDVYKFQMSKENDFSKFQIDTPSQKIIKASFSQVSDQEKEAFKNSSCLIPLSIGQSAHYGAYLAATLEKVNQSFEQCVFVLGDTLQRNTLPLTRGNQLSDQDFYQESLMLGNKWIIENAHILALLKIPYSIIRWNYWLNHPQFEQLLVETGSLYDHNLDFQKSVEINIEDYINRLKNRGELLLPEEEARKYCLKYLIEECAIMQLWIGTDCHYELYPNKRSQAMESIYDCLIKKSAPNLLKPLSIRFKKKEKNNIETAEENFSQEKNLMKPS